VDGAPLADKYPADAFDDAKGAALRERKMAVKIPQSALKKGVNVVAIEIVRAAYDQAPVPPKEKGDGKLYAMLWNTCDLLSVRVTAEGKVTPNVSRPPGMQAWNNDILNSDYDVDFGPVNEPLLPVKVVGPKNGLVSGKFVLGNSKAISGLKVSVSELKGKAGSIPASAVRVRYAMPWWREHEGEQRSGAYKAGASLLGMLVDHPPAEFAVSKSSREKYSIPLVNGAVVPVWLTVKIPANAAAGTYEGTVTAAAAGEKAVTVPLQVSVADWKAPDPQDFSTWVELIESPDTLSMEYGDPLWSDKHWQKIAESMQYMKEVGSGVLYVPLIAHANLGNDESMVRWIDKGGGKFDYDFSIMEKYLDLAEKNLAGGKPKVVVFNVWDVYMIPSRENGGRTSGGGGGHRRMVDSFDAAQAAKLGSGPLVTVLDKATGKTENVYLPAYADAKSKALWAPLLAQVKQHMEKRGLGKAMMLGMVTDALPTKEEVEFYKAIAPGVPWVSEGHGGFEKGQLLQKIAPLGYQTSVWMTRFADEVMTHGVLTKQDEHVYGWKQPQLLVDFERNTDLLSYPASRWFYFGETNITGAQRGMGRIAGDYWPAMKDRRGRRAGTVTTRYPESAWMNLNICNPILAPGPDGPVATTRFEAFREGVYECEARIAIERALADETLRARLGKELADRCQKELDARVPAMWKALSNLTLIGTRWGDARLWRWTPGLAGHIWFLQTDWQGKAETLYGLAGEVSKKLGTK
jgi:hypothetical protein